MNPEFRGTFPRPSAPPSQRTVLRLQPNHRYTLLRTPPRPSLSEPRRAARVPSGLGLEGLFTATRCRPYPSAPQVLFTAQYPAPPAWLLSGVRDAYPAERGKPELLQQVLIILGLRGAPQCQGYPKVCTRGGLSCQNEKKTRRYSPPCCERTKPWQGKRAEGGWVGAFVWHRGKKKPNRCDLWLSADLWHWDPVKGEYWIILSQEVRMALAMG